MIIGMFCFTMADLFIKLVSKTLPLGQIMLFLGIGSAVIFGVILKASGQPLYKPDFWSRPVMLRNIGEIWASLFIFHALAHAPLTTVSVIMQTMPLFLTLAAALFLGESVSWRRTSALLVGFLGTLIVLRPGMGEFDLYASFAVLGVLGMTMRDIGARLAPASVSTMRLSFYGTLSLVLTGSLMLMATSETMVWPTHQAWGQISGMILMATCGFAVTINAVRMVDVAVIAPFRYVRIIFAVAAGMFFLGEQIDTPTAIGSTLIVAAGLYSWLRERKLAQH